MIKLLLYKPYAYNKENKVFDEDFANWSFDYHLLL